MARACAVCETVNGMSDGPLCKWCLASWRRAFGAKWKPGPLVVQVMHWAAQIAVYGRAPRRSSRKVR